MKAIRFYLWTSFVVLVLVSTVALFVTNLPPVWAQVGPGEEDLTVTDPIDGLWHIRSVPALAPVPTAAHVAVTVTIAPRPPAPIPPPPAPGAPTFINYPAPDDCTGTQQPPSCIQPSTGSTTAAEHAAGEPSIGVDWNTGKAHRADLDDRPGPDGRGRCEREGRGDRRRGRRQRDGAEDQVSLEGPHADRWRAGPMRPRPGWPYSPLSTAPPLNKRHGASTCAL